MSNEISNKERLVQLGVWLDEVIDAVKKDLKADHLKKDFNFCKKYFPGKNIHKLENQEIVAAYKEALMGEEEADALAEFIIHRWIFKNGEIYHFFEERLRKISPDFTEIVQLTDQQSDVLQQEAFKEFGALRTYLFSYLNGVAFSSEYFKKMAADALLEKKEKKIEEAQIFERRSLEDLKTSHATEISRLKDKYEKKLLGVQKKYTQDVDMLKKQLASVQRKLAV